MYLLIHYILTHITYIYKYVCLYYIMIYNYTIAYRIYVYIKLLNHFKIIYRNPKLFI